MVVLTTRLRQNSKISVFSLMPLMLSLGLRRAGALFFVVLGTLAVSVVGLRAEDWPQWRGVDRLAVWHETGIVERFSDEGLKITWRMPIGSGYAGPAVAGGRVFEHGEHTGRLPGRLVRAGR